MAKVFNPGGFRHKISFLKPPNSIEKDQYGELLDDWSVYREIFASKEPILGRELYSALSENTKIELKFRMRYIVGITNNMRIRHNENIYEIISAIDVFSAHKELLCYCRLVT